MKAGKKLVMLAVCAAMLLGMMPAGKAEAAEGPSVSVKAIGTGILGYNYSESKDLTLEVTNTGTADLTAVNISPKMNESIDIWPFEIENQDYNQMIAALAPGESQQLSFSFTARADVKTQYYKLLFDVSAQSEAGAIEGECGIYVKTNAKPEEKPSSDNQGGTITVPDTQGGQDSGISGGLADAGGVFNADPVSSGGSGSSTTYVPRVIVTGFSTDPGAVKAGSNFKLTVHLKNTSSTTAVKNLLFDFSAPTEGTDAATSSPAFLPVSGSSSVYLDEIKANGTKDITIDLNVKSDLVQKPYSIDVAMKYEDTQPAQYESSSSLSIPVKQDARFEFSEFTMSPDTIAVGEESNVSCELRNLGKIKLYNVKAKFTGTGIEAQEVFVGNVEPGATANIDGMVTGTQATDGAKKMKMTMSYEDESGVITSVDKEFQLEVTEMMEDMSADMAMPVEETKSLPIIPIVIVILIIAGAAAFIIIRKKKKAKRLEEEEEGLVDEFDRLTEDEHRES